MSKIFTVTADYIKTPGKERQHEYRDEEGVTQYVTLTKGNPAELKESYARQFLQPGFIVRDDSGVALLPPSRGKDFGAKDLAPGEVVAKYEELLTSSLVARCNLMQGGEHFNEESRREDALAFLYANLPTEPGEEPTVDGNAVLVSDDPLDAAQTNSIMGGSAKDAVDRALADY